MNTTPKKGGCMSKSMKYRIKQKDFRKLEKLAERIYNTVTVIDYFCRTQKNIQIKDAVNLSLDKLVSKPQFLSEPLRA